MAGVLALFRDAASAADSPTVLGIGSWLLAIVFFWSGTAKALRPGAAAEAIQDFGFLGQARPAYGVALGAGEIALGVFLASAAAPFAAAAAAAVLLTLFALVLARSVVRGEQVPCFCFGGDREPVSLRTLGRTGALAALAWFVAALAYRLDAPPGGRSVLLEAAAAAAVVGLAVLGDATVRTLTYGSGTYPTETRS
ncbi:MAG TPA: MauE/DoxX family redox-associated membrane protein [Gaiellaceae bacterium]